MQKTNPNATGRGFRNSAREFMNDPRGFMAKYGANVAGTLWNTGTGAQFLLGAVTMSPLSLASAGVNATSSTTAMLLGHTNWGVALACTLGIVGTGLAVWPGLVAMEFGSIFGYTCYVASQLFGMFSAPLTRQFAGASNTVVRNTLGEPRAMMGAISLALGRMPIIIGHVTAGRWVDLVYWTIWALGDLSVALSKANVAKKEAAPAPKA